MPKEKVTIYAKSPNPSPNGFKITHQSGYLSVGEVKLGVTQEVDKGSTITYQGNGTQPGKTPLLIKNNETNETIFYDSIEFAPGNMAPTGTITIK